MVNGDAVILKHFYGKIFSYWFINPKRLMFRTTKALSRRRLYDFIKESIHSQSMKSSNPYQLLNVGAGGEISELVGEFAHSIIAVDIDPRREPNVICDVAALPFCDSAFNSVICAEVLEHVFRPHDGINEMHRVLVDKGALILTTRFIYPLHDRPHDYFRYTKYGLNQLLNAFSQVEILEQLNWLETLAVLIMRLLREDNNWIIVLSVPIYMAGKLLDLISVITRKWLQTDYITAGYMVRARK